MTKNAATNQEAIQLDMNPLFGAVIQKKAWKENPVMIYINTPQRRPPRSQGDGEPMTELVETSPPHLHCFIISFYTSSIHLSSSYSTPHQALPN
jgi:hypothetical protein